MTDEIELGRNGVLDITEINIKIRSCNYFLIISLFIYSIVH